MPSACSLRAGLRADAVDAPHRQRPQPRRDVGLGQDRQPVGLVQLGGDLGEQLVRRHADRAGQAGGALDVVADLLRERAHAAAGVVADRVVHAGHVAEVDVDLVDAAVLDHRRDLGDRGLEQARVAPVLVEVDRQQHRVGAARGGLHQPHPGMHAMVARGVGGGRDDAAAGVVAQRREAPRAVGQALGLVAPAAADDHRLAGQFRVAQQFDGRVEGVHVEVGDPAPGSHAVMVRRRCTAAARRHKLAPRPRKARHVRNPRPTCLRGVHRRARRRGGLPRGAAATAVRRRGGRAHRADRARAGVGDAVALGVPGRSARTACSARWPAGSR